MRVLVYENHYMGHYYHSIHNLLPQLAEEVDEVVVVVSPEGRASLEFETLLAPLAGPRITFDASATLRSIGYRTSTLDRLRIRWKYLSDVRDAVHRVRPDYVLIPSADEQSKPAGLARLLGLSGLLGSVPCEAGFHFGQGHSATRRGQRLRQAAVRLTKQASPWKKLHIINFLVYDEIAARAPSLARRCLVSPHPIPPVRRLEKRECRRQLGMPEDGRVIGLVAMLDFRKAVREFLAAFRALPPRPDDRLILAGRLDPMFHDVVYRDNADLIANGQLIVLDRFLDVSTCEVVIGALDVVCLPYLKNTFLSAVLLNGIASGRPVLVHNNPGWPRAVVRRFGFGWEGDVTDPASFADAIRRAFEESADYVETEATRRLLEFHAPANFAETWLSSIREQLGRPSSGQLKTWPWVLEAPPGSSGAALNAKGSFGLARKH